MYRFAIEYLKKWKIRKNRKPLIIRGARQVGKSYLINMFASVEFKSLIEINFEKEKEIASYFDQSDPQETIRLLALHFGEDIIEGETLLFLDEIQASPEILAKLRYFYEKIPNLHIIAAGSLLEFVLEEHEFSMPVGRIEYLHLGPMTFMEFLLACGKNKLFDFLKNCNLKTEFPKSIHKKLMDLVKSYIVIGGMPESIQTFIDTESYLDCDHIKDSILATYKDDFNKYKKNVNQKHIITVFEALPNIVGNKLKFVNISRELRSENISKSIHLLTLAKIYYLVYHSSCNGVPLGAEVNRKFCKPLFIDVGMLLSICQMNMLDIKNVSDLTLINSGQICEQFVGQHLLYRQLFYKEPYLYYWIREKNTSNAEVDYVISLGTQIIPIEVKSGKTGSLKSLHQFSVEKKTDLAVRICSEPLCLQDAKGTLSTQEPYNYNLLSVPFYLIEELDRLISDL